MPTEGTIALDSDELIDEELAGLDNLERNLTEGPGLGSRLWSITWPKLSAAAITIAIWQVVVWSGWKPTFVLPGPVPVFQELWHQMGTASFWHAIAITMTRGLTGFAVAVVIGSVIGVLMVAIRPFRRSFGSLITGLQTMPSIAWFPLAVLLFKLSEAAILFVIILGAAPSIANGVMAGADQVPPLLVRYGRSLRTNKRSLYRHIVLPAAIPSFVGGLRQGWAFAWRSLLAGELIVIVANRPSIGSRLSFARDFSDSSLMLALIIVILVIGMLVDAVFTKGDTLVRRRYGLVDVHATGAR